jgi:polyphenol oxidase
MLSEHGLTLDLGPNVRAWMSTRAGGVSTGPFDSLNLGRSVGDDPEAVRINRERVAALMQSPLVFLHQVHGALCVTLDANSGAQQADAGISTRSDLCLGVQVADCLPALFSALDQNGRALAVAGAHAGWRGLAAGVLENTVLALRQAAPGAELRAWLGPCIGPEAFEVGEDVLASFPHGPEHFRFAPRPDGSARWRADLQGLAMARLHALGVQAVQRDATCTLSNPSKFFSFRRDGQRSGRMAAFIRLL